MATASRGKAVLSWLKGGNRFSAKSDAIIKAQSMPGDLHITSLAPAKFLTDVTEPLPQFRVVSRLALDPGC